MQYLRRPLLALVLLVLVACSKTAPVESFAAMSDPARDYLGTWSTESNTSGIRLEITRDGQRLLFRAADANTGALLAMNTATVEGGYLLVESGGLLSKLSYYKPNDSLVALNNSTPVPDFKRISLK
jgi:hypothetical protein